MINISPQIKHLTCLGFNDILLDIEITTLKKFHISILKPLILKNTAKEALA